ncbi:MAG: hypothetical protein ACXIUM_11775 [Wenzhouxiangella sp.]
MSKRWLNTLLTAAGLGLLATPALAQLAEWTGTSSSDWFTASNWSPAGVPAANANVLIDTLLPNLALINGAASANLGAIQVGQTGNASLEVINGGVLSNTEIAVIGTDAGSSGAVTVSGAGSAWTISDNLIIGWAGTGRLNLGAGATLTNNNARIGNDASGRGEIAVDASAWTVNGNLFVAHAGLGELALDNGATLETSAQSFIGYGTGSMGSLRVRGGSSWIAAGADEVFVGRSGDGELRVESGASVSVPAISLGVFSGGEGTLSVNDGSLLATGSGEVRVGVNSEGELQLLAGGTVSGSLGVIGDLPTGVGQARVSGAGSIWSSTGSLVAGLSGSGSLRIENGGTVLSNAGGIASLAGSSGSVVVSGPGSSWIMDSSLGIGAGGEGELLIENGATVNQGAGIIGWNPGGLGAVEVRGSGSQWNLGLLRVGDAGSGTLFIDADAQVNTSDNVIIANQAGSAGNVLVNGSLNANPGVVVNENGALSGDGEIAGFVIVQDGGILAPKNESSALDITGNLALNPGSVLEFELGTPGVVGGGVNDLVTVGGQLILDGILNVTDIGGFGDGVYTLLTYSGSLINNGLSIGSLPGGVAATIDTSVAGEVRLIVGVSGPFTWIGGVSNDWFTAANWSPMAVPGIGDIAQLDNVIPNSTVIDGPVDANTGILRIGTSNQGELIVRNGANLNSTDSSIASFFGASGSARVTGPGSRWASSIILTVGANGPGSLHIDAGGIVRALRSSVGTNTGSAGDVTINGDASQWLVDGELLVGRFGSGSVLIENNALLESQNVSIAFGNDSSGVVVVDGADSRWNNNDEMIVGEAGNNAELIIRNGGRVDNRGNAAIGGEAGNTGALVLEDAGSVLNNDLDLFVGFEGDGLLDIGTGSSVNVGGSTTVALAPGSSGELRVNGSFASESGLIVREGGVLSGDGSVQAATQVRGGRIAPGSSAGTLDISGPLDLDDASVLSFELDAPGVAGGGVNDLINVGGDLILAGTLEVTNLGGMAAGSYTLLTYIGTLTDNTLSIGALPAGFAGTISSATPGQIQLLIESAAAPVLSLEPSVLAFGDTEIGSTAGPLLATLSNTGDADLIISGGTAPAAPFIIDGAASTCASPPFTLTPGASCLLAGVFSPTAIGPVAGTLLIESNAASSPDSLSLSGTGIERPEESIDAIPVPALGWPGLLVLLLTLLSAGLVKARQEQRGRADHAFN